jgi:ABC-type branched-subunit amino acid transport system permease subunit
VRLVLMGVALIALMVWRPQGLLGKKEEVLIDAR